MRNASILYEPSRLEQNNFFARSRLSIAALSATVPAAAYAHGQKSTRSDPSWTEWPYAPEIMILGFLVAVVYLAGWWKRRDRSGAPSRWRHASFVVIGSIAAAVVGLIALVSYSMSSPSGAPVQKQAPVQTQKPVEKQNPGLSNFVRFHSPRFGNSSSRVTVVEWFDPECEGCRAIHPPFEKIMAEYSNRVHFVFRYMPYHANSMYASAVLEEARELGKFKEALNILFEKQPEWGSHRAPRPDLIPTYLEKLGIPKEKLERSYVIKKHGAKIKMDEDDGLKVGVRATPTFFVNGQPLSELGEQPLRAAINKALSQAQ